MLKQTIVICLYIKYQERYNTWMFYVVGLSFIQINREKDAHTNEILKREGHTL